MEQQREDSFLQTICSLVGAAVHEQILAARMSVDITVKQDVT